MFSEDLVATSSKLLIVSLLSKGESYGYEIIKSIHKISDEEIIWKEGRKECCILY